MLKKVDVKLPIHSQQQKIKIKELRPSNQSEFILSTQVGYQIRHD